MAPASVPAIPSRRNQDPAHVMDFPSLNRGHAPSSKRTVTLVDLDVTVYGLDEIAGSTKPVVIIILSHGWANNAAQMENMACGLLGDIRKLGTGGKAKRDVLVATVDQRNHGTRRLKKDTLSYNKNPLRLLAMTTTITGGMEDHNLIMKVLPGYLFPFGERRVVEFMVSGVSLGGHLTWRLLRSDPRIRVAVPIIAVPPDSLGSVHTSRFRSEKMLGTDKMYYPQAVKDFYEIETPLEVYDGKKILALHGSVDQVMPGEMGYAEFDRIAARIGKENAQKWVQEGRGHICTPEMVERAAEWFFKHGVAVDEGQAKAKL